MNHRVAAGDRKYLLKMLTRVRNTLADTLGSEQAGGIPLLYGGTVNQENASEILQQTNTDGLFVGRATWEISSIAKLIDICIQALIQPASQR